MSKSTTSLSFQLLEELDARTEMQGGPGGNFPSKFSEISAVYL